VPGQESLEGGAFGGFSAGGGACAEVVGEVGEELAVVAFGGGGDGPDGGGEVGGLFGVAAVVVLPTDDRSA
jgi:hypothetical protein